MGVRRSHIDCFPRPGGTGVSELSGARGKREKTRKGENKDARHYPEPQGALGISCGITPCLWTNFRTNLADE